MKRKPTQNKSCIKLRNRALKDGSISLYLDYYFKGKRQTETLGLYLHPNNKAMAKTDEQTLALANAILGRKLIDYQNGVYGFGGNRAGDGVLLFDYIDELMRRRERPDSAGNINNWKAMRSHLEKYTKKSTTLGEIDERWLAGFRDYLAMAKTKTGRPLAANSQCSYFAKACAVLNSALKDGLMKGAVTVRVEPPKPQPTERQYLTAEEVQRLISTPCYNESLGRAFLFSCLTGLRWSDVTMLKWSQVTESEGVTRLAFRQKKTGGLMYLDINPQAAQLMGERREPGALVFGHLTYSHYCNIILTQWAYAAGVNKRITFHCSRHTFAMMLVEKDVEPFVLQQLLGHGSIHTTQIYVHIADKKKREAVSRLPQLLPPKES